MNEIRTRYFSHFHVAQLRRLPLRRHAKHSFVRKHLEHAAGAHSATFPKDWVELFMECCRMVESLTASERGQSIVLRGIGIDAEFLLSNLFGLPTNIRNFDELLGGGGLVFHEDLPGEHAIGETEAPGRAVLITGRCGTGKSFLALHLAAEVASKGGIAWVMPLEQSIADCLYMLDSIVLPHHAARPNISTDALSAESTLFDRKADAGGLIILRTLRESYGGFLSAFRYNSEQMKQYPLRLIVADPINGVCSHESASGSVSRLRVEMANMIRHVKEAGTNIILVAEETTDSNDNETTGSGDFDYANNIADTVIRLSVQRKLGYSQRYLEVRKSRFQREQRGEHPFSIRPVDGITITPSPASVLGRTRALTPPSRRNETEFGVASLDKILGEKAIFEGDVIVFEGSCMPFNTQLGISFLLYGKSEKWQDKVGADTDVFQQLVRSLFVSARDSEADLRDTVWEVLAREKKLVYSEDILVRSIPKGHVKPGQIFNLLEDELQKAHLNGYRINRLVFDDLTHLEASCPFIREDRTFADTLVEFLRKRGVTCLMICGEAGSATDSVIQRPLLYIADCVLHFERIVFRGASHVLGRVVRARSMKHSREPFEVSYGRDGPQIRPAPLLRILGPDQVKPVDVRFFLHAESGLQKDYNNSLVASVEGTLTPHASVESPSRICDAGAMRFGRISAVDQLQILQLDEFQIQPHLVGSSEESILWRFPRAMWDEEIWNGYDHNTLCRIGSKKDFFAVPYYENVSLLAWRTDCKQLCRLFSATGDITRFSWHDLRGACEQWERRHRRVDDLFFDWPLSASENYNCLFFEILLSIKPIAAAAVLNPNACPLCEWFCDPASSEASKIFRRLCRRSYFRRGRDEQAQRRPPQEPEVLRVDTNAKIWWHWYTTLNQMLHDIEADDREKISVVLSPGKIAVAGEWYLGIPVCSAAPEVGLGIIKLMTTREAELERLRAGVGLPTRCGFYGKPSAITCEAISPYFSLDVTRLGEILKKKSSSRFRRSDFGCYYSFRKTLTFHLQRIIEIPEDNEGKLDRDICDILASLKRHMDFTRTERNCSSCIMKDRLLHGK